MDKIENAALLEKCRAYNRSLKKARIIIEHTFGMLKKRFPVLLYELRSPKVENIAAIISSAVVLHNILIRHRDEMTPPEIPSGISEETFRTLLLNQDMSEQHQAGRPRANQFKVRDMVVQKLF
jgi:hypothetical protein